MQVSNKCYSKQGMRVYFDLLPSAEDSAVWLSVRQASFGSEFKPLNHVDADFTHKESSIGGYVCFRIGVTSQQAAAHGNCGRIRREFTRNV